MTNDEANYLVERLKVLCADMTELLNQATEALGRIEQADTSQTDVYPLTIVEDRYTGVYSNGKYTAWNMYPEDIPQDIEEDDVTCANFWYSYDGVVGLGNTPNEAVEDLCRKLDLEKIR